MDSTSHSARHIIRAHFVLGTIIIITLWGCYLKKFPKDKWSHVSTFISLPYRSCFVPIKLITIPSFTQTLVSLSFMPADVPLRMWTLRVGLWVEQTQSPSTRTSPSAHGLFQPRCLCSMAWKARLPLLHLGSSHLGNTLPSLKTSLTPVTQDQTTNLFL